LGGLEGVTFICPSPIFLKHWALPKIEACVSFPSAHLYSFIYESSTFAIVYGIKVWWYFGNTFWKLDGNTLGTEKTKLLSPPFQNLKDKNCAPPKCMSSLLIGHMKIMVLKQFVTIFSLGLRAWVPIDKYLVCLFMSIKTKSFFVASNRSYVEFGRKK
jgi:hypothetical protein